jgi:hypothetical protein
MPSIWTPGNAVDDELRKWSEISLNEETADCVILSIFPIIPLFIQRIFVGFCFRLLRLYYFGMILGRQFSSQDSNVRSKCISIEMIITCFSMDLPTQPQHLEKEG